MSASQPVSLVMLSCSSNSPSESTFKSVKFSLLAQQENVTVFSLVSFFPLIIGKIKLKIDEYTEKKKEKQSSK